ncbi:isoprenoid synthase domain-containing protein [Crucibulum laeve]|uniref:Isoprenoid synthase domain-containing protein n=1 Tax=Crucibulum laeve TaxID=68775 RepID=A0A5C3M4D5_9AGAR|nr:isoprenoid synthase domain-containing protein [Crucibulum laeve]
MYMSNIPESYIAPCPSSPSQSKTAHPYTLAQSILIPLGEYFQIQDDWLDFSSTPEQIGKIGTEIVDNKCLWVVNTALVLANPEQRRVLDENYGGKDSNKEEKVKQVFWELKVGEKYTAYEEKVVGELK